MLRPGDGWRGRFEISLPNLRGISPWWRTEASTGGGCAACLFHDLVRDWPDHAHACGELMVKEGWPVLGEVICVHHDLPEEAGVEAALLYLADKLVQGERTVSLHQRFGAKRSLCRTPKALAAWERRYHRALQAAEQLGLDIA